MRRSYGDGDMCPIPVNDSCGQMFVLNSRPPVQYCPNSGHYPTPGSKRPFERTIWPYHRLAEAVAMYKAAAKSVGQVDGPTEGLAPLAAAPNLPDLGDIDLA